MAALKEGKLLKIATILVLFILLILVSHSFSSGYVTEDNSIGATGSARFDVTNYSGITLNLSLLTGDTQRPDPTILYPYNGTNRYELVTSIYRTTSALVNYRGLWGVRSVLVSFTMQYTGASVNRVASIVNYSASDPLVVYLANGTKRELIIAEQ